MISLQSVCYFNYLIIIMKSILYTTLIFLFTSFSVQSFAQGCDGFRYLNDIATSVSMETVQFGQNTNGAGETQDLYMDIYTPDGDSETSRPAILYAFGGSFIGGNRSQVSDFCERYAKKGYVTVAIDYRLYDILSQGFPDSLDMIEEVVMAVADMKAAVRYMRNSANTGNPYGIDGDKIYAGGISAGALVGAHAAYINELSDVPDYLATLLTENGGIEGDTDLPGNSLMGVSAEIQAVINQSGALHRASFMEAGDAPIVSSHGDEDDVVPYGYGFAAVAGFDIATVQGSSYMHARALEVGIPTEFYSVDGGGHVEFYGQEPHATNIENMVKTFLHDEVTCSVVSNENLEDVSASVSVYPNPVEDKAIIAIDGSLGAYNLNIVDQLGRTVRSISNISDNAYALEREDLITGIYYVQLQFHNENLAPANKKVVFK